MAKKRKIFLKQSYLVLAGLGTVLLPIYNNCSNPRLSGQRADIQSVTSVGNPMRDDQAKEFASKVCSKLISCNSILSTDECETGIRATSGIVEKLGLPPNAFSSFEDLILAEKAHLVIGTESSVNACAVAIQDLPCSNSNIINAFSPTSPAPFQGVSSLVASQASTCAFSFACVGNCAPPPAVPTSTPAPTSTVTPTPSPSSSVTCRCQDMASLLPGAIVSCPSHPGFIGPALGSYTLTAQMWSDAACTNSIGSRRAGVGSQNMGSTVFDMVLLGGNSYRISDGIPCIPEGTGSYVSMPPTFQWEVGYCTWQAQDFASCQAAGCN